MSKAISGFTFEGVNESGQEIGYITLKF